MATCSFDTKMVRMFDVTMSSMVIGSTAWIFFIQSGVLMKLLGREQFVPIMMKITKTFMPINTLCLASIVGTTYYQTDVSNHSDLNGLYISGFALGASLLNYLYVAPTALSIGGRTMKYRRGQDQSEQNTVGAFVRDGGSAFDSNLQADAKREELGKQMKFYHRSVAFLVVCSAAGTLAHLYWLLDRQ